MKWQLIGLGSRVKVYGRDDTPFVVKQMRPPVEIAAQFEAWGMPLGEQPWSPVPGDSLRSAISLFEQSYASYELAWRKLRIEAGLVQLNLDPQDLSRDPHEVRTSSYVQLRAESFGTRLQRLAHQGDRDGLMRAIDGLVDFVRSVWQKGLTENTFEFRTNYGYPITEPNRLIMLDVGELSDSAEARRDQIEGARLLRSKSLTEWLDQIDAQCAERLRSRFRFVASEFDSRSSADQGLGEASDSGSTRFGMGS